jgi:hypothetical protein
VDVALVDVVAVERGVDALDVSSQASVIVVP